MEETGAKRGPGRSPKADEDIERAHIDVRVSDELRRQIRVVAAQRDINMDEWLREVALEKLAREALTDEQLEGIAGERAPELTWWDVAGPTRTSSRTDQA